MKKNTKKLTPQEHRLREYVLVLRDLQTLVNMELENFTGTNEDGTENSFDIAIKDSICPLKSLPETALRSIIASERYRGFLEAQEGRL